jgi:hypothetical protein
MLNEQMSDKTWKQWSRNMARIRTSAIIAAAATVMAVSIGIASPAMAAPSGCAAGAGCSWSEANYKGKSGVGQFNGGVLHFQQNIKNYLLVSSAPGYHLNDKISSVFNNGRTGAKTKFYKDADYKGAVKTQSKGAGVPNLQTVQFNDVISSACFDGYCR